MHSLQMIPRIYKADRYNVLGEEITEYVHNGMVEYNPDRSIKMTFQAEIDSEGLISPFTDFLAPFLKIVHDDGHTTENQMGLYAVVPPKQTINQQSRHLTIDGRDLTWMLSVDVFENGYSVAAGTNVVTAVETILTSAGFTRFAIAQSSRSLVNAVSWKAGTSKLSVINDLLTGAGYYSLYCLKDGRFSSMPYRPDNNPTVQVTYDTDVHNYIQVVKNITLDTTPDRIANKIVVIKDNANEDPIVVTKINNSPVSPTSTINLGMTIAKVYTDSQIIDQEAAEVRAQQLLDVASQQYHKLTLATFPDVEREPTNEVYQLNIRDSSGEIAVSGIWRCRGWKIGFTPNQMMTHDLSNISDPPREF